MAIMTTDNSKVSIHRLSLNSTDPIKISDAVLAEYEHLSLRYQQALGFNEAQVFCFLSQQSLRAKANLCLNRIENSFRPTNHQASETRENLALVPTHLCVEALKDQHVGARLMEVLTLNRFHTDRESMKVYDIAEVEQQHTDVQFPSLLTIAQVTESAEMFKRAKLMLMQNWRNFTVYPSLGAGVAEPDVVPTLMWMHSAYRDQVSQPVMENFILAQSHPTAFHTKLMQYGTNLEGLQKLTTEFDETVKESIGTLKSLSKINFGKYTSGYYFNIKLKSNTEAEFYEKINAPNFYKLVLLCEQLNHTTMLKWIGYCNQYGISVLDKMSPHLDVKYFDPELVDASPIGPIYALIKMGVPAECMFSLFGRKEAYRYIESVKQKDPKSLETLRRHMFSRTECLEFLFPQSKYLDAIARYTTNRKLIEWGVTHENQLAKKVTYMGQGLAYETNSFHLLETMTEEDLTHGNKTSFHKVKQIVVERQYRNGIPKEDTPLPVFPASIQNPKIRQLVSSEELLKESIAMSHCVVTYYQKCIDKESYIFHVDDGSKHGVTIEVVRTGDKWVIAQAQSYLTTDTSTAEKMMEVELWKANN